MTMKVHDQEDREQDHADHHVTAHQEAAECLDDMSGSGGTLVASAKDKPCRRDVQRQAEQRRQQ